MSFSGSCPGISRGRYVSVMTSACGSLLNINLIHRQFKCGYWWHQEVCSSSFHPCTSCEGSACHVVSFPDPQYTNGGSGNETTCHVMFTHLLSIVAWLLLILGLGGKMDTSWGFLCPKIIHGVTATWMLPLACGAGLLWYLPHIMYIV